MTRIAAFLVVVAAPLVVIHTLTARVDRLEDALRRERVALIHHELNNPHVQHRYVPRPSPS